MHGHIHKPIEIIDNNIEMLSLAAAQIPMVDVTKLNIPEDWLAQLAEKSGIPIEAFNRHIGDKDSYGFKGPLQVIYSRLTDQLGNPLATVSEKAVIIAKLQENIDACSAGYIIRVNSILLSMQQPKNLAQLLFLVRMNLVDKVAAKLAHGEVHAYNRCFIVAATAGYGVIPNFVKDPYQGNVSDDLILQELEKIFKKEYRALNLPFLIVEVLRGTFTFFGYEGVNDKGYTDGTISQVENFLKTANLYPEQTKRDNELNKEIENITQEIELIEQKIERLNSLKAKDLDLDIAEQKDLRELDDEIIESLAARRKELNLKFMKLYDEKGKEASLIRSIIFLTPSAMKGNNQNGENKQEENTEELEDVVIDLNWDYIQRVIIYKGLINQKFIKESSQKPSTFLDCMYYSKLFLPDEMLSGFESEFIKEISFNDLIKCKQSMPKYFEELRKSGLITALIKHEESVFLKKLQHMGSYRSLLFTPDLDKLFDLLDTLIIFELSDDKQFKDNCINLLNTILRHSRYLDPINSKSDKEELARQQQIRKLLVEKLLKTSMGRVVLLEKILLSRHDRLPFLAQFTNSNDFKQLIANDLVNDIANQSEYFIHQVNGFDEDVLMCAARYQTAENFTAFINKLTNTVDGQNALMKSIEKTMQLNEGLEGNKYVFYKDIFMFAAEYQTGQSFTAFIDKILSLENGFKYFLKSIRLSQNSEKHPGDIFMRIARFQSKEVFIGFIDRMCQTTSGFDAFMGSFENTYSCEGIENNFLMIVGRHQRNGGLMLFINNLLSKAKQAGPDMLSTLLHHKPGSFYSTSTFSALMMIAKYQNYDSLCEFLELCRNIKIKLDISQMNIHIDANPELSPDERQTIMDLAAPLAIPSMLDNAFNKAVGALKSFGFMSGIKEGDKEIKAQAPDVKFHLPKSAEEKKAQVLDEDEELQRTLQESFESLKGSEVLKETRLINSLREQVPIMKNLLNEALNPQDRTIIQMVLSRVLSVVEAKEGEPETVQSLFNLENEIKNMLQRSTKAAPQSVFTQAENVTPEISPQLTFSKQNQQLPSSRSLQALPNGVKNVISLIDEYTKENDPTFLQVVKKK